MILLHKKFLRLIPACAAYFTVVLCITMYAHFSVQMYKVYCYLLVPPFLWGIIILDESMSKPALSRIGNRRKALLRLLSRQYLFAAAYLFGWFVMTALFAAMAGEAAAVSDFPGTYVRYLSGLILLVNCCGIFKRLGSMAPPTILFGAAYVLLLVDALMIPSMTNRFGPMVKLVFAWIFSESVAAYLILAVWIIITFVLLLRRNEEYDIL